MENIKAEFKVPKYQLATIYKGLIRLTRMTRKLYFYMTQADRIVYYDEVKKLLHECKRDFCIAFDFQDERPHWYMLLVGDFHTLTSLIDEIRDENVLKNPLTKVKDKDKDTLTKIPKTKEKLLLRIYEEIGKIDEDICKWRATAINSKNASK